MNTRSALHGARRRRRRHGAVAGVSITVITLAIVMVMTYWIVNEWSMVASIHDDPYGGVPHCTHEIANAGGICHGEPR